MDDFVIRNATKEDASYIAKAIMSAVGDEITDSFAGEHHTREDVYQLFRSLARRDDSQYSYRNSIIAESHTGEVMGAAIGYDGAKLSELRVAFFQEAESSLGYQLEGQIADETSPDEYYLDTIAVTPEYRGRGVAMALINAIEKRATLISKPLGLLVDKTNRVARNLYKKVGFQYVDERPFAGEMMDHLQL